MTQVNNLSTNIRTYEHKNIKEMSTNISPNQKSGSNESMMLSQ